MIPVKKLSVPQIKRHELVLTPAYFKQHGKLQLTELTEQRGCLVRSEKYGSYLTLEAQPEALFASSDTVYASYADGRVKDCISGNIYTGAAGLTGAVTYCLENGDHIDYLYGEGGVYALSSGVLRTVAAAPGPSVGAVYRERLYLASGSTLVYSAPLEVEKFDLTEEDTGRIPLSDLGGDILAMIPYGDRLIIFRRHEILKMRADAYDLNFSFTKLKFDAGEIAEGSIQRCGKHIFFQAAGNLWVLEGDSVECAPCLNADMVYAEPTCSAIYRGMYYTVAVRSGVKFLLRYDPEKQEYVSFTQAVQLMTSAKTGLYFSYGKSLMRLAEDVTDTPFPASLLWEIDLTHFSRVMEGITLLGTGSFELELQVDGKSNTYQITGEKRRMLRHTLPAGRLRMLLRTYSADCVIRAIVIHMREVAK